MLGLEIEDIDLNMEDFGFDLDELDSELFGEDFNLADEDKGNMEQITFTLTTEQMAVVKSALDLVKDDIHETFGNENKNGNAIYEVVRQWVEQKTQ